MKKIKCAVSFLLVLTLLASCFAFNVFAEDSAYSVKVNVKYGQSAAREILPMINSMRKSSDAWYWNEDNSAKIELTSLEELAYDYTLEKIAMQRAAEIALSYSHTRTDGSICFTALSEFGYSALNAGENIAAGSATAEGVNKLWREDDEKYEGQGHRRNMLSGDFNAVGIGHVTYNSVDYWVEVFAKTNSADSAQTPASDDAQDVSVKLDGNSVSDVSISVGADKVTAKYTKESDVPNVNVEITMKDNWPGVKCLVETDKEISVGDPEFVQLKDNKLKGLQLGLTQLDVTALGKSVSFPLEIICEHEYEEISRVEPTCTSTGILTKKCKICGHIEEEELPKLGHNLTHREGVEPTCTKAGSREYWHCSLCGRYFIDEKCETYVDPDDIELAKTTHMIESIGKTVKATHFKKGSVAGSKCSVCGKVFSEKKTTAVKKFGKIKTKKLSKGFKVSWSKISGASGFKIMYSANKKFKSAKTVTIKSKSAKSAAVSKLKSKKTYYVKVRAYKTEKGSKLYSTWSSVATVKTK